VDAIRSLFVSSEPLLLFTVIGLGFVLGQVRFKGFSLGMAGVLFVGLLFGGWKAAGQPPLALSHQITQVGLILFVYAAGLTSGPGFFASFKKRGVRFNLAALASVIAGAVATLVLGRLMGVSVGQIAGVFCGAQTNTPALAATTELTKAIGAGDPNDPTVGYSVAYPFGVLGGLLALQVFVRLFRKAFDRERAEAEARTRAGSALKAADFEIRNPALFDRAIGELRVQERTGLIISRHRHGQAVTIPTKYTLLREGDVVVAVGTEADIQKGADYFGAVSPERLEAVSGPITMRRILVSRKQLVGQTIEELELDRRFNAQVTRLRRADIDMIPHPDTVLEIGDRLRVVMPTEKSKEVSEFFGDSERSISELDYLALTLGISLGVLIGLVPLPVPGGASLSLGFAGGPLIVGLILGRLGRTGPLVWSVPLEANHVLRHIGLLIFMAGVGVMAGGRFFEALPASGLRLFTLGAVSTALTAAVGLWLLRRFGGASIVSALGATSGIQTQPATLARAYEMSKAEEVYIAYATTYPVAMVGKILIAQALLLFGHWMG